MKNKLVFVGALMLLLALALAACSGSTPEVDTQAPAAQAPACPTAAPCPTPLPPPEPVVKAVPFQDAWANSPHADAKAEAFVHWDSEDPKEVPAGCAKCHSETGFLDFLGEDGTAAGTVENPAPVGTVVSCAACHNASTAAKTSVVFPSGAEITGLGAEARCMECHQGRASKVRIDSTLEEKGLVEDLDKVDPELGFVNIHYYAAAATLYGTETKGGYEYEGKTYDAKFDHVAGFDTCVGCHNSHTLEVKVEDCAGCHLGIASQEDLKKIRMAGSMVDYDGDGDTSEGIATEIEGLQAMLYQAIQAYATEKSGTAIAYDSHAHPYFFADTNSDGQASADEAVSANGYKAWTGRLLKAAYNYQTSLKDPGAFAHGGKYILALLNDSLEDLNSVLSSPVDLSSVQRIDAGHFAGSEEAFRHWDADGLVPADCARCHTASGLPTFLDEASRARDGVTGINIAAPPSNGLNCATCHNDVSAFTRFEVGQVKFPSGALLTLDNADSNLCLSCHQGRESTVSVDRAISGASVGDDEVSERLSFRNPHYFAAGATLFGTDAKGAYEYDGKEYNGTFQHVEAFNTCIECHDSHGLAVKVDNCQACHGSTDLASYRAPSGDATDYDGDGDVSEGLAGEIATLHEQLYAALQTYAAETAGTAILYDSHAYPYFFADANANGALDADEGGFASWTPRLLRAAYNYQWVAKDPGAAAHNGKYILQVLYDGLEDLGGSGAVEGLTRPAAAAPASE